MTSGPWCWEGSGTLALALDLRWVAPGALVVVAALLLALLVLRRLERGPGPPSVRALRRETDRAIAECDDAAFFVACRAAVQARLAERWGCAPGSITLVEMRDRGVVPELQAFFEVADAVAYSGRLVFPEEMRRWQELVLVGIARLEKES